MSMERARAHLARYGLDGQIREFEASSATVELAAEAVGCEPARIVKTLSFKAPDGCLLLLCAGDAKVDNAKFKQVFGFKAKMLEREEAEELIGHAVGGVCPFGVNPGVKVFFDQSIRRFDVVYPAAGTGNSAVKLTIPELARACPDAQWVDACKGRTV
ncbi:MAG: YbaK/EbsC family protein [Clostridia bacterium]